MERQNDFPHIGCALLIIAGLASGGFGVLAAGADMMSDQPGPSSGGCAYVIGGMVAVVAGTVGLLL